MSCLACMSRFRLTSSECVIAVITSSTGNCSALWPTGERYLHSRRKPHPATCPTLLTRETVFCRYCMPFALLSLTPEPEKPPFKAHLLGFSGTAQSLKTSLYCSYGPTIALLFVLAVAAIKAIVEDKKRHEEDRRTNNTPTHRVREDGEACPIQGTVKDSLPDCAGL